MLFILITVTLDMLALGLVLPVLPRLVRDMLGGDTAYAATMIGYFGTSWAGMQLLCSPLVGALSDRFGRRPVALISNFGQGFDYLVMAAAPNWAWLFVGRMVSGVTAASVSVGGAYIADITPKEKRAHAFGLLGAAFNIGFIAGPALGGVLGNSNPRLPFFVAGALSLLNAVYGYFVLPESLAKEKRSQWQWKSVNPLASFTLLRSHKALVALAMVALLANTASEVLPNVTVLYTDVRYLWDARQSGLCLAAAGALSALVQAFCVGKFVSVLGETRTLQVSLLAGVAGFLAYAFAPVGWVFLLGMPLMAISSAYAPVQQSLMTRYIRDDQQGSLQGAQSSLWGLAGMIGPQMFTFVFAQCLETNTFVGAPFVLAGIVLLLSVGLARYTVHHLLDPKAERHVAEQSV